MTEYREWNSRFFEEYKHLDGLCGDLFSCAHGVTAYIEEMEQVPYRKKLGVTGWDADLALLKQMRWRRNRLAHECSFDEPFCTAEDAVLVRRFCTRIMERTDPLAKMEQMERIFAEERAARARAQKMAERTPMPEVRRMEEYNGVPMPEVENRKMPRQSLWTRFKNAWKSLFS